MDTFRLPLALLLVLSSTPAFAGGGHGGDRKHSCPMHDPTLGAEERARAMDEMFAKLDADADGSISRAEFDRHHEEMARRHDEKHADAHGH
jgi:hypothetical protein